MATDNNDAVMEDAASDAKGLINGLQGGNKNGLREFASIWENIQAQVLEAAEKL
jgi:hypothetical protein